MIFSIRHWAIWDDSFAFQYMQGEDNTKHTNGKCYVFTFQYARGRYAWTY